MTLVVGLALLATGACSSDADPVADQAPASTSPPAATPTGPTTTPTPSTATPSSAPATPTVPPPTAPAPTPTSAAPVPTVPPTRAPGASRALRSVRRDVASIAPQLEAYYRDREYPVDLDQVRQTLADSGVVLSSGNEVGGYTYDGDAVEFVLCVQNTSGAWADYDTSPMALQQSGETGGCP